MLYRLENTSQAASTSVVSISTGMAVSLDRPASLFVQYGIGPGSLDGYRTSASGDTLKRAGWHADQVALASPRTRPRPAGGMRMAGEPAGPAVIVPLPSEIDITNSAAAWASL